MTRYLAYLGSLLIAFGATYGVTHQERVHAEHKVCVERKLATEQAVVRADAIRDMKIALIEASENGAVVKGYVVPDSIHKLKGLVIAAPSVPKC